MSLSTIFFTILYGGAIVFIILYLFRSQQPPVVIYPVATSIDYPETSWWPWSVSSYNRWPYWTGWWSGGSSGGYGGHMRRPIYRRGGHERPWGGVNRSANRSAPRGGFGGGAGGGRAGGGRAGSGRR